jgi:tRNA A-37 threonylcarbamoyl transferase component Bud32
VHTFEEVREEFPNGVEAHHAPWLWRRILEVLSFVHRSGWAHGAITPAHLLVHPREHGVLPVGWGDAREATPEAVAADVRASARAVGYLLDGSETPQSVAALLIEVSKKPDAHGDAWALREKVGEVARGAFGPPRFMHFAMPGWD